MKEFIAVHKPQVGLVSPDAPLISNLSVWSNIALIRQYHQNLPMHEAKALAENLLGRFAMGSIAERRNPDLTTEERFCVKLLRAATVEGAILVLDRPFAILTDHRSARFLTDALRKVDDMIAETHIFDYSLDKERYEVPDGAEA